MKKQLKHKQFLQLWYNRIGVNNKSIEKNMEKIYNGFLQTLEEEVRLNGEIRLKNFGKFYLLETGGYERRMIMDGTDGNAKHFVPIHYLPRFQASQNFKDYVNDAIVSKEGRRNKKRGKLTELEKELEQREVEKTKTDIRRILERKKNTGESISEITKDTRMQIRRD